MEKPLVAAEQQLIDKLKRIEYSKASSSVLLVRLSALNPANRTPNQVKMAQSLLNETVVKSQSTLFALTNNDLVLIGQNIPPKMLNDAALSIKRIFQSDSFVSSSPGEFTRIYPLAQNYDIVMSYAKKRKEELLQISQSAKTEIPLAPEHLDAILRNIQGFNILKIIRRQEAIQITPEGNFSSLFMEYFTSMSDLKKAIAPDVNVLSNRWLFQHLSETLDIRMLGIYRELFEHTPKNISLNLNISTIFTSAFEDFLDNMPKEMSVIVEIQLMDVFQNTQNYLIARDLLHDAGHQVLIDGLHPISFEFMDMNVLESDLMKLNWTPALTKPTESEKLAEHLKNIDPNRLILMRCENEAALCWAVKNKITRFQGYFIDALTAAAVKKKCPQRHSCNQDLCVSRKACIAGLQREGCLIPENLDLPIEYKRKKGA